MDNHIIYLLRHGKSFLKNAKQKLLSCARILFFLTRADFGSCPLPGPLAASPAAKPAAIHAN